MKIEVNIEKKYFFAIIGLLIIVAGIFLGYAYGGNNPQTIGHSAGEVMISVNGTEMTLQNAITQGKLGGSNAIPNIIFKAGFMNSSVSFSSGFKYNVTDVPAGRWAVRVDFRGEPSRDCSQTLTTSLNGIAGPSFSVATDNEWSISNGNYYSPSWIIDVSDSGVYANKFALSFGSTSCLSVPWGSFEAYPIQVGIGSGTGLGRYMGITPSSYNGNVGGYAAADALCSAAFAGSHVCSAAEFSAGPRPTVKSWYNTFIDTTVTGGCARADCNGWLGSSGCGTVWGGSYPASWDSGFCSTSYPFACCK